MATLAVAALLGSSISPVDGYTGSRKLAEQCEDNPQDYNLSFDIQIAYPDGEVDTCNTGEINRITSAIQSILGQEFASTVEDWAGKATFINAKLDASGQVNNLNNGQAQRQMDPGGSCPTSREDVFMDCKADFFCRWGCVTAQTTNCGAPLLANWADLGGIIQQKLVGLELDCLGDAEKLHVNAVVDDPKAEEVRAFKAESSKDDKTEEEEESRVAVGSVARPSTGSASGSASGSVARPSTGSASGSVARPATGSASGTTTTASVSRPTTQAAEESRNTDDCVDNPVIYNVALDIQVDNPSSNSCASSQWTQIKSKASQVLNDRFESQVRWNGNVGFGTLAMDTAQEIKKRRRALRGQELEMEQQGHRQLSTCPIERVIPCNGDTCYWGCLIAHSTSCGINSLASWSSLEEYVRDELASLNYNCLGNAANLEVNLYIKEPEMEQRSFAGGIATTDRSNKGVGAGNNSRTGVIDLSSKLIEIHSKILVTFFATTGELPDTAAIAGAETALSAFFKQQFLTDKDFQDVFQDFSISNIVPDYDFAHPDQFVFSFLATVSVDPAAPANVNTHTAANVMAGADYRGLIRNYIRGHGGEFDDTFKVMFWGTAPGHL